MNLGELKTQLFDLVARTDYTEAKMAEHLNRAFNRIQRVAELPNQEKVIELQIEASDINTSAGKTVGVIEVPEDMLSVKWWLDNTGRSFESVPLSTLLRPNRDPQGPSARWYSRLRDTWMFLDPAVGEILTIVYHANWIPLVKDTDFNEITTQAPDAVLYAAAHYAAIYFVDARGPMFEKTYLQLADDLKLQQWNQERASGSAQTLQATQDQDAYYGGY